MQHAGQFDCNIARSDDSNFFRLLLQFEKTVRCNAKVCAVHGRYRGFATGCQQNSLGGVGFVANLYGVGIDQRTVAGEHIDIFFGEVFFVNAVQTPDVVFTVGDQLLPVEAIVGDIKAVTFSVDQCVGDMRAVPHDFFRYATAIYTRAAVSIIFNHCTLSTVSRGAPGCGDTAAATTNGNKIVLIAQSMLLENSGLSVELPGTGTV